MTKYKKLKRADRIILNALSADDLLMIRRLCGCSKSTIYNALGNSGNLKKGSKQEKCYRMIRLVEEANCKKNDMLFAAFVYAYLFGKEEGGKYGNILPGIDK